MFLDAATEAVVFGESPTVLPIGTFPTLQRCTFPTLQRCTFPTLQRSVGAHYLIEGPPIFDPVLKERR